MGTKGEKERGQTARQPGRTHNRRHTAATEHTIGRRGREQRDQAEKKRSGRKKDMIYLRERGEKKRR